MGRTLSAGLFAAVTIVASSGGGCNASGSSVVARFKLSGDTPPNFLDVPFPSDAYRSAGKLIDPIPGLDAVLPRNSTSISHELGKMSGYTRMAYSMFYVDDMSQPLGADGTPAFANVDPATLPVDESACVADTSAVFLVDLASGARVRCRASVHDDTATSGNARPLVAVGPGLGVLLDENHAYAAVLTSRVRDKAGSHLSASADFKALLAGSRAGSIATMYGAAIDQTQAALKGALAADKSEIVAIAPFTTNAASGQMFKLRESLEAMPVPTIAWDAGALAPMGAAKFAALVNGTLPAGFTASLDDWLGVATVKLPNGDDDPDAGLPAGAHNQIAAIGTAVFQAPNFLITKPGGYTDVDHATFNRDPSGNIVPATDKTTVPIWATFAIPKAAMPAGGYPCVIVLHGSGGDRSDMFFPLANTFAAQGWITVAIDSVTFGARAPEAKFQVDQLTSWQNAPGATYHGPDGFADNLDPSGQPSVVGATNDPFDMLGHGVNVGAARDQLLQAAIDTSSLVRMLRGDPDLVALQTGAVAPKIDGTKIAFLGASLGAGEGAITAAIEPNVKLWVLNVGGTVGWEATHAPDSLATLKSAALLVFGITGEVLEETHPAMQLLNLATESGEFAPALVKSPGSIQGTPLAPRNVLMIEALYDTQSSNDATEAFARAAGFGLAAPNVGPNAGISTMDQVRDPTKVPDRIPLPDVQPDSSQLIHDSPIVGVTSVLVQTAPAAHYGDLRRSTNTRTYSIPYTAQSNALPANQQFPIRDSYVELQAMVVRFFADGFAGAVPNVTGFKPPVRDFDDDGTPDATDPDPNNPAVK